MSEYDLTGSLPEEDELFLPPEEDFNTHGFEPTKLQQFSDAEIEAFDRDSREISIEAESLALTHSSGEVLDEEIAKMLG